MKNRLLIVLGLVSPVITITLLMLVHGLPINGTTAEGRVLFLSSNFALFANLLARQFPLVVIHELAQFLTLQ